MEPFAFQIRVNVAPSVRDSYRPSGACSGPSPQPRPPGISRHGPVRENVPPVTDETPRTPRATPTYSVPGCPFGTTIFEIDRVANRADPGRNVHVSPPFVVL